MLNDDRGFTLINLVDNLINSVSKGIRGDPFELTKPWKMTTHIASPPTESGHFCCHYYNKAYSENLGFGENVVGTEENVIARFRTVFKKAGKPKLFSRLGKYEQIMTKGWFSWWPLFFTLSLLDKRGCSSFNNR